MSEIVQELVKCLIDGLNDESKDVRRWAVLKLGEIGPAARAAVPALTEALKDEMVQYFAARSLGHLGPKGIQALIDALQNGNKAVRRESALALGMMGPKAKSAVPALIEGLRDEEEMVRFASADALGEIGEPAAVPALAAAVKSKGKNEYWGGLPFLSGKALGRIGPAAGTAVPALTEGLRDEEEMVRFHSAAALGRIGPAARAAVPALSEALKDKSKYVRYAAAKVLEAIRGS